MPKVSFLHSSIKYMDEDILESGFFSDVELYGGFVTSCAPHIWFITKNHKSTLSLDFIKNKREHNDFFKQIYALHPELFI